MRNFNDVQRKLISEDPYLARAMETVGAAMAYRDRKGLTQNEFAALAQIPSIVYKKIEEGKKVPSLETLSKIARTAGL